MENEKHRRSLAIAAGLLLGALLGALLPLPKTARAADPGVNDTAWPAGTTQTVTLAAEGQDIMNSVPAVTLAAEPAAQTAEPAAAPRADIPAGGVAGVDISVWQGKVDFAALKADGIRVVYIRAGEGDLDGTAREDANFARNSAGAAAAGLDIGYYYYLRACSVEAAEAEAEQFWALIADKPAACRPAMDYESFCSQDSASINRIASAFLTRLSALAGQPAMLYTDEYRVRTLWEDSLTAWPLWVADYDASSSTDLPDLGFWRSCAGFQYTDKGRPQGIAGVVDRDVFYASAYLDSDPSGGCQPLPPACRTYTVQRGDTLWGIALRYGATVQALAAANHIADPNLILPGQVLRIP